MAYGDIIGEEMNGSGRSAPPPPNRKKCYNRTYAIGTLDRQGASPAVSHDIDVEAESECICSDAKVDSKCEGLEWWAQAEDARKICHKTTDEQGSEIEVCKKVYLQRGSDRPRGFCVEKVPSPEEVGTNCKTPAVPCVCDGGVKSHKMSFTGTEPIENVYNYLGKGKVSKLMDKIDCTDCNPNTPL